MYDLLTLFNAFAAGWCLFAGLHALREDEQNIALFDFFLVLLNVIIIVVRTPH
jgi:hypothetical protein